MLFAISGFLMGTALGMRFTVVILLPATLCACAIAWATSLAAVGSFTPTATELVLFLACLQVGYIGGSALRLSLPSGDARFSSPQINS